jgi:ADP-ribosylglycohydrolase
MTRSPGWHDRAAGVLLASAAGDALGAGYEFTHPASDATIDMVGGGPFDWAPGEWTDDTSMTLAVARVTATGADLNSVAGLDAVAAGFVEWYDSHPKDIGNQTRAVLSVRNATAAAMTETARRVTGRKGGNGSLMRTAAVGLAYLDASDDAADACASASARVGALTHDDQRAVEACQIWSHAIRHAVLHGTFDRVAVIWTGLAARPPTLGARSWPMRKLAHRRTSRRTAGWCTPCRRPGGRSAGPTIRVTPGTWPRRWSWPSGPAGTPTRRRRSPARCSAPAGVPPRCR